MAAIYLPSITTLSKKGSTWQTKLAEILSLEIDSFAIFVTGLTSTERKEFFEHLLKAKQKLSFTIPFCHAVSSMSDSEFRFLSNEFGTQWFNLHPVSQYPLEHSLSLAVRQRICIENYDFASGLTANDCEGFNGLCLDLSHLQDTKQSFPEIYESIIALAQSVPVRANHISGFSKTIQGTCRAYGQTANYYSDHYASHPSEFEYLQKLPPLTQVSTAALELEIPIFQQLAIVKELQRTTSNCAKLAA